MSRTTLQYEVEIRCKTPRLGIDTHAGCGPVGLQWHDTLPLASTSLSIVLSPSLLVGTCEPDGEDGTLAESTRLHVGSSLTHLQEEQQAANSAEAELKPPTETPPK